MELHPHGPIEQAIQKTATPEIVKPKSNENFWWGAVAVLGAGVIAFWVIYSINERKEKKDNLA